MKNGSAAAEGSLAVGDILLKIDGESLINSKHKKAVKLLQKVSVEKWKVRRSISIFPSEQIHRISSIHMGVYIDLGP